MNQSNKPYYRLFPVLLAIVLLASFLSPAFHASPVSASTEVGGIISTNITWTKANSPYIVTSSVLVNQGVTLTIEPGITVKFDSGKAIQIDGQLIARGTEAEPIVFTSNQPSPAPGDWVNILFSDSSVGAMFDEQGNYQSGCILQYCTVEYGGGASFPVVKIVQSSPLIDHCTITQNASSGIYAEDSSAKISSNTISSNNSATSGGGGGICASGGTVTISGNTISNNSASYSGGGISTYGGTVTISGNTISNNSASYSGGGIYASTSVMSTISGNTISNNSTSWGGGIHVFYGTITISGNTISNNSASSGGGGICASGGTVTISGNTISNNSTSSYGGGIYASSVTGTISYNEISGNTTGNGIHISGQPTINYNNIHDNSPYDVRNSNSQGSPNVDVTNNWWGTTNEATIQAYIYDWFDDAGLGIIDYVPYLTSEVDITPPATPLVTDDGATTNNNAQLHATWTSSDPESGIAEYQYAIGTSAGGTDVVGWTSAGTATEVTKTGLSLSWGTTYYFAVKANNGQGLWSEVGVSDGITVSDTTPPTTPVVTDDGASTSNNTQLHATWTTTDPESGIAEYQYAIGTSAGGTDVVGWTSAGTNTEVTKTGLNLTWGTTYYFAVKAKNGQGVWSEVGVSDGITVSDSTQPTTPIVTDDGASTSNTTQLHASWTASDTESGIAEYQYAIGTSAGGTDVVGWTSAGTNTEVTKTGLSLTLNTTYYFVVKAKNGMEAWSEVGVSDGITVVAEGTVQNNIPASGGTVQSEDDKVAAEFPAGAVTTTATVTIKEISASSVAAAPKGFKVGNTYFTIEAMDATGNAIVTLSQPVTITVKYSDEDVAAAGGDPNKLALAYYDEASGEWQIIDTEVNTDSMTLSATTSHLSQWAVLARTSTPGLPLWSWILIGIAALVLIMVVGRFVLGRGKPKA